MTTYLHQQLLVLHQQLPVLNQRPPSCISRYQSCTSNYLSNDYQLSNCTSYPVLHQQLDLAPATTIWQHRLFVVRYSNFTIRHNKVWPFKAIPLFCHSCLVHCQSLIFQKFAGPVYLLASTTHSYRDKKFWMEANMFKKILVCAMQNKIVGGTNPLFMWTVVRSKHCWYQNGFNCCAYMICYFNHIT